MQGHNLVANLLPHFCALSKRPTLANHQHCSLQMTANFAQLQHLGKMRCPSLSHMIHEAFSSCYPFLSSILQSRCLACFPAMSGTNHYQTVFVLLPHPTIPSPLALPLCSTPESQEHRTTKSTPCKQPRVALKQLPQVQSIREQSMVSGRAEVSCNGDFSRIWIFSVQVTDPCMMQPPRLHMQDLQLSAPAYSN